MLGALVARIDSAFHGLESREEVMRNPDLVHEIMKHVPGNRAKTVAGSNKILHESVHDCFKVQIELCSFMDTLVKTTVAEVRDRTMEACCLGPGKYLIRLVDRTAMGYVVMRPDGATVTTFSRLGAPKVRLDMHLYSTVCVRIKVCVSDTDELRNDLAAWGRKEAWSWDVESEVGENGAGTSWAERYGYEATVFDDAPRKPHGLTIWRTPGRPWQFEYNPPDRSKTALGTIIRRDDTALVWGFAERVGAQNAMGMMCYSMDADAIRSSEALYHFITTHEWTNPRKVTCAHVLAEMGIKFKMHPPRGAPGLHSAAESMRTRVAALERFVGCADGGGVRRVKLHVVFSRCSRALQFCYGGGVAVAYLEVYADFAALLVGSAGVLYKSDGVFRHAVGQPGAFYGLTGDDENAITLLCGNINSDDSLPLASIAGFSLVKTPWVGEWTVCGEVEVEGQLFRRIGQSEPDAWDPRCMEISIPAANTMMTLRWADESTSEWRMENVKPTGFEVSDPAHPGISLRCGVSVTGYNDIRLSVRRDDACVSYPLERK
jgi:hypothetical protein